ncbi:hypothetical protein P175DRAFT_0533971 [Aspergillus ochraceoroseus IBT 24754]|uniref:Uncharacterized protein n=1 Tax=Aspergillus ochraceoroseus IBT 24754 TaxID=1392256 RepID=A0A2T5LTD7_9EURO|nr:uncharacterized protein P175DRAFT_0533971 [Aspergillus ochraceoroseus IBT 24754]PTU19531.1 hypothetical protein P175DRAFT_0533971 [Aspergillus ochraceoroseus IBT 24754]
MRNPQNLVHFRSVNHRRSYLCFESAPTNLCGEKVSVRTTISGVDLSIAYRLARLPPEAPTFDLVEANHDNLVEASRIVQSTTRSFSLIFIIRYFQDHGAWKWTTPSATENSKRDPCSNCVLSNTRCVRGRKRQPAKRKFSNPAGEDLNMDQ